MTNSNNLVMIDDKENKNEMDAPLSPISPTSKGNMSNIIGKLYYFNILLNRVKKKG